MFVEIQDSDRHAKYHRAIVATVGRFRDDHMGQSPTVLVINDALGLLTAMVIKAGAKALVHASAPALPGVEAIDTLNSDADPVADVLVFRVHRNNVFAMQQLIASAKQCVRHNGRYCVPEAIHETVTPCAWGWAVGPDEGAPELARGVFFREVMRRFGSRGLVSTADAPIVPATSGRLRFVSTGPTTRLSETDSIVIAAPDDDSVPAVAVGWIATLSDGIDLDNNPHAYRLTLDNTASAVARAMVCGLWVATGFRGSALPRRLIQTHRSIEGVPVFRIESSDGIIEWTNELRASRQGDEIKYLLADIVTVIHTPSPAPEGTLFYNAPTAAIMAAAASPDARYLVSCPSIVARAHMAAHFNNLAVASTVNRLHVSRQRMLPMIVQSTVYTMSCPRRAAVVVPSEAMDLITVRFDPIELARQCCPEAPAAAVDAIRRWLKVRDYKSWPLCGLPWAVPAASDGKLVVVQRRRGNFGTSGIAEEFLEGYALATSFGPRKLILVEQ